MLQNEEILCQAGDLYATNKRVIKYSRTTIWEDFGHLAYGQIASLKLVNKPTWGLVTSGIIIAILGGLGWYFNSDIARIFGSSWRDEYKYIAYGFLGLGILFAIMGFVFRYAYYQVLAAGTNPAEWRVQRPVSVDTTSFVQMVREHLN